MSVLRVCVRFNDVWVLDMTEMRWSCPNIRGKKPSGRFGHSQVFICFNSLKFSYKIIMLLIYFISVITPSTEKSYFPVFSKVFLISYQMAVDDHTVLILGGCGGPNLVSALCLHEFCFKLWDCLRRNNLHHRLLLNEQN